MTNNFTPKRNGYNKNSKPKYTPAEYADHKQNEKDKVFQSIDDTAVAVVSSPEKFMSFLDTQARMDRYSTANALLINAQLPESTQLKDFAGWGEDNIRVKKGSKSISILEPVEYSKSDGSTGISYNVKKVFDVSQTNGKRKPAPTANHNPKELVSVMIDSSPVNVEIADSLSMPNLMAQYDNEKQTIYILRGVQDSVALAQSMALELAFAQLSIDSDTYNRREFGHTAACVAYMLCKKFGVDSKVFTVDRIPVPLKNAEAKDIRAELSKMRSATTEIYNRVANELYRQKQARSKDMER